MIERDADFARFAARILLTFIYEEVLDWDIIRDGVDQLKDAHRRAYVSSARSKLSLNFSVRPGPFRCHGSLHGLVDYLDVQTLYDRYLIIDKTTKKHRRLDYQIYWCVSMGSFMPSKKTAKVMSFYLITSTRAVVSVPQPTLFNSDLHSQLSSCYLYKVDDSIESIMHRGIADNAFFQMGRRTRRSWTAVRGTGDSLKEQMAKVRRYSFLKLHNDQLVAVNQGSKRRAQAVLTLKLGTTTFSTSSSCANTGTTASDPRYEHRKLDPRSLYEAHGGARGLDPFPFERSTRSA